MNNIYYKEIQLKMARNEDENYYKLRKMRIWYLLYSEDKLSLYNLTGEEENQI